MPNPLELIEARLKTQTASQLADAIGVSAQYLSMVRRKLKPVGPKILTYLGIERAVTYRALNGKRR
jgi:hypothetical protein